MYFCLITFIKLAVFIAVAFYVFNLLKKSVPELRAFWEKLNDPRGEKAYYAKKLADRKRELEQYQKLSEQMGGLTDAKKTIRKTRRKLNTFTEE